MGKQQTRAIQQTLGSFPTLKYKYLESPRVGKEYEGGTGQTGFNLMPPTCQQRFKQCLQFFLKILFIYFWQQSLLPHGLFSLVAASRGCFLVAVCRLLIAVASLLWNTGSRLCGPQ